VVSFEMHSPILAVAAGTPAVHLRQPTDTRKGQMWRDVGLGQWLFEIDCSTGAEIAACVTGVGRDLPAARRTAEQARALAYERMAEMMGRSVKSKTAGIGSVFGGNDLCHRGLGEAISLSRQDHREIATHSQTQGRLCPKAGDSQ
jgi:hypothetical protein